MLRYLREMGKSAANLTIVTVYSFDRHGGMWMNFALSLCVVLMLLAAMQGSSPSGGSGGMLVVIEKGAHSLAIVDPVAGKLDAAVPEGGVTGHEVAASADGRFAYVPIYGDSGVGLPGTNGRNMVVIDIALHKVTGNVDFGHGVRPHLPVWGPDGLLYVTTELDNSVTIVDPKTLEIIGTIPTNQPESHMLAISHDGKRGYTANVGPGTVSVLDLKARKTIATIPISKKTQRISISINDRLVFTADQTKPQLAVIDTATNQVKTWIPLPGTGYGSAPTPDGKWLLIALPDAAKVAVIDLRALKVARTIDVPPAPQAVLIRPDGKVAYASCDQNNHVAEIDLATWKVTRLIPTGSSPDGMAWAPGK
jgi:YVTN family beta-propeller protein